MVDYRVRFSKENSLKFLSHLDLIKAVERALRRAEIPLAYSKGFHPHPKLSFGPALPVGISSIEEYFDMELIRESDTQIILERLNLALPDGIRIHAVKRCKAHTKALNAIINRAAYLMMIETEPEVLPDVIWELNHLSEQDRLEVRRTNKNGPKVVNIRPWLHNLKTETINRHQLQLKITGEIGSGGNLRPEDIIQLLTHPVRVLNMIRVGMWHEEKEVSAKPLDLC